MGQHDNLCHSLQKLPDLHGRRHSAMVVQAIDWIVNDNDKLCKLRVVID
jgi:hypothetical protein